MVWSWPASPSSWRLQRRTTRSWWLLAASGVAVAGGICTRGVSLVAASDVDFPSTAYTAPGRAVSRLCALQCNFATINGSLTDQCGPVDPLLYLGPSTLQRNLHVLVAEAGGGREGGSTHRIPGGDSEALSPWDHGGPGSPGGVAVTFEMCVTDAPIVPHEEAVAAASTLYRNSLGGSAAHAVEVDGFAVIAISSLRLGVCLDAACTSPVAVDTTRAAQVMVADAGGGVGGAALVGTPIITHVGIDGVVRPVAMADAGLLSLGRAALASPTWFSNTSLGAELDATVSLSWGNPTAAGRGPHTESQPALTGSWRLGGPTAGTAGDISGGVAASWADAVAQGLCLGDEPRSWLCFNSRFQPDWPVTQATWAVVPPPAVAANRTQLVLPPWPLSNATAVAGGAANHGALPPLLWSAAPREINPASGSEAALAAALPQRLALLPVPVAMTPAGATASAVTTGLRAVPGIHRAAALRLKGLSSNYDSNVWSSAAGRPPATATVGDLLLAGVVVLPEVGALLGLALTTPVTRSGLHFVVFHLVYWAGLLSLISVRALVVTEAQAASWSGYHRSWGLTAVLPDGVDAVANRTEGLAGAVVVLESTLVLGMGVEHRLPTVRAVALALTFFYGLVITPLVVLLSVRYGRRWWCLRQGRLPFLGLWGKTAGGGAAGPSAEGGREQSGPCFDGDRDDRMSSWPPS